MPCFFFCSQVVPCSLAMFVLRRLLVSALWLAVSRGSTRCPLKCTCGRFGKFIRVKCLGIDEVPTGIPSNTILLYVSWERFMELPRDILTHLPLFSCFSLQTTFREFLDIHPWSCLCKPYFTQENVSSIWGSSNTEYGATSITRKVGSESTP